MENKSYLSSNISNIKYSKNGISLQSKDGKRTKGLSPREREVLQLLAEGNLTKEIARRLHVSAKTIDNHRQNIMNKLDLHCVADLTRYAINEGLTPMALS